MAAIYLVKKRSMASMVVRRGEAGAGFDDADGWFGNS
jgi:hypothetical protein